MPLQVPEYWLRYYIVAIDPAISNIGVAVFEIDYITGKIISIRAFTIVTDKIPDNSGIDADIHGDRVIKIAKAKLAVLEILNMYNPVEVTCEAPFFYHFRPGAYAPLVEAVCAFQSTVIEWNPNVKFTTFPPLTAKKTIGATTKAFFEKVKELIGKKPENKDLVKVAIMGIPEIMNALVDDIHSLTDHAIDGIAIGYTLIKSKGI